MPTWTKEQDSTLIEMNKAGKSWSEIANHLQLGRDAVRNRWRYYLKDGTHEVKPPVKKIIESNHPIYTAPLEVYGNCLILPDVEIPFHHADFLARVIDLAEAWGIDTCVLAGDFLHFDSLSGFDPNWTGGDDDGGGPSLSQELSVARVVAKQISDSFKHVYYILGNHEGRFLRKIGTPTAPEELLRLLETNNKWKIAPYYYCKVFSGDEIFLIEHPKCSNQAGASKLANKFSCHVVQGHSHLWDISLDASGQYWAIHTGCIVDERRLPYAAQRHYPGPAHALGATIIHEGFPYVLHEKMNFELMMGMVKHGQT